MSCVHGRFCLLISTLLFRLLVVWHILTSSHIVCSERPFLSSVATHKLASSLFSVESLKMGPPDHEFSFYKPGIALLFTWDILKASVKVMSTYCCLKRCVCTLISLWTFFFLWGKLLVYFLFSSDAN